MAEAACMDSPATLALPQVVIADFRLHEMPKEISAIIDKYAAQARPLAEITPWPTTALASGHDGTVLARCNQALIAYLSGRDWPLPTVEEFYTVQAFNELLAWVLVFGRCPNHFTLSIHHLTGFNDLGDFHSFIENEAGLILNHEGGAIKGGPHVGIAQGSTVGTMKTVQLLDGTIDIPTGFIEFVWRYPTVASQHPPMLWRDYFRGFIAEQANHVIESLYAP
jgi:hypothetical protein